MGESVESIPWSELAARALARQFPIDQTDDVAGLAEGIGPIQAQAARAPFLGLAARNGAVDQAGITAAYEALDLVRGSSIRGTVHTSTPGVHPVLDVLTRVGVGARWRAQLGLKRSAPEDLWASLDAYARDDWRTPDELRAHQAAWLAEHDPDSVGDERLGRYLAFSHGAMIRRPLKGGWEGQGAPVYRTAAGLLGDRSEWYADPGRAVREAVRLHLRWHGPSSCEDIAWWSGVNRTDIAEALAALGDELTTRPGPDGRAYHDLPQRDHLPEPGGPHGPGGLHGPGGPPEPGGLHGPEHPRKPDHAPGSAPEPDEVVPGVRLLPGFDALLCAYEPAARMRFIDPEHHRILFSSANGLCRPPMLVDGRITGYWGLDGSGRTRSLTAFWFAGTSRPRIDDVRRAARSVTRALPVRLSGVELARHRE